MTQEDVAGAAQIDRSYISEIENEHFSASVDLVERLARALGVAIHEMFLHHTAAKTSADGHD